MSSPVANPDLLEILENTPFVVAADDFLSNDTDADGDSLSIISWGNADHVTVTRLSDGSFWSDRVDVIITLGACLENLI